MAIFNTVKRYLQVTLFILIFSLCTSQAGEKAINVSEDEIYLLVDETQYVTISIKGEYSETLYISLVEQNDEIIQIDPAIIIVPKSDYVDPNVVRQYNVSIYGKNPGRLGISANITPTGFIDVSDVYIRVTVQHSKVIYHISIVVGWIYFVAWSVSFYPQIYINYQRKSVVGLNFDFIVLNIVGFVLYSLFNLGLYFIPIVQEEYFNRHPRGLNPVLVNDIVFSLHAAFATLITIAQCFIYKRDNQTVSMTARTLLGIFGVVIVVTVILAATAVLTWLDFLYYCSYIKLTITLIKYIPQAYMNYQRKSTVGWSIGNIFLDFVGGTLSMLQMILNAYNYNDWVSIFGDPTKFGLGLFSVIFDIFFIVQHYVLYRNMEPYQHIAGENSAEVNNVVQNEDED